MPACVPRAAPRRGSDPRAYTELKPPPPLSQNRIKVSNPRADLGFFLVETRHTRMENMNKRIALVAGGVGGIGTAICKRLAADGLFVVANYAIPGSEDKWHASM